jgi:predicted nucleotidyltransferase
MVTDYCMIWLMQVYEIYLFGSRVDDAKKEEDIDIIIF